MTFDELPSPWQKANEGSLSPEKREEFIARTCRTVEKLEASFLRRDLIESVIAVICCWIFGSAFLKFEHAIAKIGATTVVLGCLYIIYKLHRTRNSQEKSRLEDSVRDFCKKEIGRMDGQIRLLKSVLWWYISPILLGVNLIVFGLRGVGVFSVSYLAMTLILSGWIYAMNQKAVTKTLTPAIDELKDLMNQLGER